MQLSGQNHIAFILAEAEQTPAAWPELCLRAWGDEVHVITLQSAVALVCEPSASAYEEEPAGEVSACSLGVHQGALLHKNTDKINAPMLGANIPSPTKSCNSWGFKPLSANGKSFADKPWAAHLASALHASSSAWL